MDTFTLYGSTICFNCQEPTITASPTSLLDPMKDSTDPPDDPNKLDITLPPGWGKKNSVKDKTIIVTLPLVLAFVICFLIIGCLFWRKSRAKKYREHDIEMKALQLRRNDEDNESIVIQAARTKQRLWARATARWKANARYTARQRRGKRSVASRGSASYSSAVSLPNAINDNQSTNRNASTSSRSPSRRTSISNTTGPQYTTENAETPISISVSPPSPAPASPPAYHQPLRQLSVDNLSSAEALSRKQSFESVVGDSSLRYITINSAHVATDDKALLARLGELASEPPVEPTDSVAASALEVSAPVWQDEQLEDFATISDRSRPESLGGTHHGSSSFSSSYHSSGFPLPPPAVSLKGKEADLSYYEYEYSYDDIADVEPEIGPSAPPFDEFPAPSAPPLDDSFFGEPAGPSAPPFPADEDDHAVEQHYDRSMLSDSTDDALEFVDEEELRRSRPSRFGRGPLLSRLAKTWRQQHRTNPNHLRHLR
ncbi:hypothetical protein PTI98_000780 [Pleurotus ostreatus]|nr:hypothetical protein PTI98_000780 [Pleurotus ostreatus]